MNNAVFDKAMENMRKHRNIQLAIEKAKLCCRNTNGFIIHVKTEGIYKDIAEDAEKGFNTSNYNIDTLLPKGENEKVIGLMKDELGGKIVTKFVGLRPKIYSYLKDNNDEGKKAKGTIIKKTFKFQDYKN